MMNFCRSILPVFFLALACFPGLVGIGEAAGEITGSGRAEALGVVRFDHISEAQLPSLRIDLELTQRFGGRFRWKLGTTGRVGGPVVDPSGAGLFDLGHTFQNIAPSLELDEAWVEYRGDTLDLRVGNQRFFWGKLDAQQPNDLLSPRQWHDPLITDEKRTKIAVPAVSADWYFPDSWQPFLPDESRVSLVWQPFAVPWRYPLTDERWFAPALRAPATIVLGAIPGTPCPCDLALDQSVRNTAPPVRSLNNGNVGLRLSARSAGVDWDLVYFNGYDPQPNFSVAVQLHEMASVGEVGLSADVVVQPAYERFQSLGGGAAFEAGDFTWRTELAYRSDRPWPMTLAEVRRGIEEAPQAVDALINGHEVLLPAYVKRDAVEWGVGADTFFFDDLHAILELHQTLLIDNDVRLLVRNVDTKIILTLRKPLWNQRVETEFVALFGVESGYQLLRVEADYAFTDALHLKAGALLVAGTFDSLIGQYRNNDEAFFRMVWSF
jgi:hypothetical protein